LFERVNRFAEMVKKDRDFTAAGPVIDFLDESSARTSRTKRISWKTGIPFLDVQRDQHERLRSIRGSQREMQESTVPTGIFFSSRYRCSSWIGSSTTRAGLTGTWAVSQVGKANKERTGSVRMNIEVSERAFGILEMLKQMALFETKIAEMYSVCASMWREDGQFWLDIWRVNCGTHGISSR
jgi:hypothetical protein